MNDNFNKCLVKGDVGEMVIDELLTKRHYYVYKPVKKGSHPIDRLVVKDNKAVAVDVKCKPKRDYYPDTGFDLADYEKYIEINKDIDVWIFFVDENLGTIYYQSLNVLKNKRYSNNTEYPFIQPAKNHETGVVRDVIYFSIDSFVTISDIPETYLKKIKELPYKVN